MRIPVLLPPIGSVQAFEAGGGTSVARAARTSASYKSSAPLVRQITRRLLKACQGLGSAVFDGRSKLDGRSYCRAMDAGYTGLPTADLVYSRRERDVMKSYVPMSGRSASAADGDFHQASMTWDTIAHIKETHDIPLIEGGNARTMPHVASRPG